MEFADVAVDAPVEFSRTFTYRIPPRFSVQPGQLVWVPFGRQTLQGIVARLSDTSPVAATRDILQPVEPAPLLDDSRLQLGHWISRHYRCSLFTALSPMLPPGFETQVRTRVSLAPGVGVEAQDLRPETVAALTFLAGKPHLPQKDFAGLLGRAGMRELDRLVERGLVHREALLPSPQVAPRYEAFLLPSYVSGEAADGGG